MSKAGNRGRVGEEHICAYLSERGWDILARNFRIRGGEIDIIAEKDRTLAFVEVKTRKFGSLTEGIDAIDKHKKMCMIKAADRFIENSSVQADCIRFDAAFVIVTTEEHPRVLETEYIEDAFDAVSL